MYEVSHLSKKNLYTRGLPCTGICRIQTHYVKVRKSWMTTLVQIQVREN